MTEEEYININELIDDFQNDLVNLYLDGLKGTPRPREIKITNVIERIEDFPTADVAPVRHGRWYSRGGRFRCSVCDNKAFLKDIGGTGGWSHEYEQQKSPYCPNCGAKMDGGD